MSLTVRTRRYSKPVATTAASLMHVPPSLPGKSCEPLSSFQLRMWLNPSMVVLRYDPPAGSGLIREPSRSSACPPTKNPHFLREGAQRLDRPIRSKARLLAFERG